MHQKNKHEEKEQKDLNSNLNLLEQAKKKLLFHINIIKENKKALNGQEPNHDFTANEIKAIAKQKRYLEQLKDNNPTELILITERDLFFIHSYREKEDKKRSKKLESNSKTILPTKIGTENTSKQTKAKGFYSPEKGKLPLKKRKFRGKSRANGM